MNIMDVQPFRSGHTAAMPDIPKKKQEELELDFVIVAERFLKKAKNVEKWIDGWAAGQRILPVVYRSFKSKFETAVNEVQSYSNTEENVRIGNAVALDMRAGSKTRKSLIVLASAASKWGTLKHTHDWKKLEKELDNLIIIFDRQGIK